MADKINDGGPAFPQTNDSWQGPHAVPEGMSLRDFFAAMVIHSSVHSGHIRSNDTMAGEAYFIADAMLKARELRHASQS